MEIQTLSHFILQYQRGTISPQDKDILLAWRDASASNKQLFQDLNNPSLLSDKFIEYYRYRTLNQQAIHKVLQQNAGNIEPLPPSSSKYRFLSFKSWWAAASIVLFLALSTYFWLSHSRPDVFYTNTSQQPQRDILPGSNKAILTLADGTTIALDKVANGLLAQQGAAMISKLSNGEIIYNLKGEEKGGAMMNTMHTPCGGQYQLMLPDGTKVWLNAASSITYPAVFVGRERKVKITGEVYFEVAQNSKIPFFVSVADQTSVEVLGTNFNINSYTDEETIKTTLIEGSVKVKAAGNEAVLKAGQQITSTVSLSSIPIFTIQDNADLEKVMAWKNGLFNFQDKGLKEIMRQLSRWYNIDVVYADKVADLRFFGEMRRDVKLSSVLNFLEQAGVNFKMENDRKLVVLSTAQ